MLWEPLEYERDTRREWAVNEAILRTRFATYPGIVVDIASGDCTLPKQMAERFKHLEVIATDCRDHREYKSEKYLFVEIPIEEMIKDIDPRIDIVTMLGTYYRFPEGEVKDRFHKWLQESAEYFVASFEHKSDTLRDEFEWAKKMQYDDYGHPIYLVKLKK